MHVEKIISSNVLKPGQLLAVLKCHKFYGNTGFFYLQQSLDGGHLHFYRHRQEPVPWISRVKHGRLFRRPRTTNERRAHFSNKATKEIVESHGVTLKLRHKRKSHLLPNAYDDLSLRYQRSWKEHRGTQAKNAGKINRRFHSPPYWAMLKDIADRTERPTVRKEGQPGMAGRRKQE
jgi:hypothetical protein